jgi:hypothetical protein
VSNELELGDPVSFYNGTETLRFDKKNWKWYRALPDGNMVQLDGVTGIVHIIDKSFYLMPWACKMMAQKIMRTVPRVAAAPHPDCVDRVVAMPVNEFSTLVDAAKTAHKEKLEDAGDVGHAAHEWIEASIRNAITFTKGVVVEMTAMAPIDERAVNCGLAAWVWMQAHNVRFQSTERYIYSRKFGYAGTCDGTALVDSCDNPACCARMFQDELSIIDWKTSNYLYVEFLYQTAAYQNALEEEFPDTKYAARWILRLGKEEGDFASWYEKDFTNDWMGYLYCLELSRQHKKVERRMGDQKKLLTQRKRAAKAAEKEAVKEQKAADKAAKKALKSAQ